MRKLKILLIKNRILYSLTKDLEEYKQFLNLYGIEPEIEYRETDWDLNFKRFYPVGDKEYWGLDEIKQRIRENVNILPFQHQIVMFCYDVVKSGWIDNPKLTLAAWTYPNPMFSDEAFIEIPYRESWVGKPQDFFEHETTHALGAILSWRGKPEAGCIDNGCPLSEEITKYQKNFDVLFAPLPVWKRIKIIREVLAYLTTELKKKEFEERERLVRKIAQEEGVDADTLVAVLRCESGLNPEAVNINKDGSKDWGIAQLNDKYYKDIVFNEVVKDPAMSIRITARRFKQGMGNDWVCYKTGKYIQFKGRNQPT